MRKCNKVYLRINNDGMVKLPSNMKVNRDTVAYYAEKRETVRGADYESSVWFLIRPKDVKKLEEIGYSITKILIPKGYYAVPSSWNETFIRVETWTHCNNKIYYNLKGEVVEDPLKTPLV